MINLSKEIHLILRQFLNNWDVSNVNDMSFMFSEAKVFNRPLNKWDVSNVKDMSHMFSGAVAFNQNLNTWDVSSVLRMEYMFSNDINYAHSMSNWVLSSCYTSIHVRGFLENCLAWYIHNDENDSPLFCGERMPIDSKFRNFRR